jgi:UV DNA damage endonuclease
MPLRHLGYACINTELRKKNIFCSRTCREQKILTNGFDVLHDLALKNLKDLKIILEYNEKNNIKFFRVSSQIFPFYTKYDYTDFLHEQSGLLQEISDFIGKYKHRVSMHPGQYTLLNSDKREVIENSIKDLEYHTRFLNEVNSDQDGVIILHGGCKGKDKKYKLQLLNDTIRSLPQSIRKRLVLENDEIHFNVDELLVVCNSTGIPLVLDYHHDNLYPSKIFNIKKSLHEINKTWGSKTPKRHVSDPRDPEGNFTQQRAHHDFIKNIPDILDDIDIDIMIEAKAKEQALYRVRSQLQQN